MRLAYVDTSCLIAIAFAEEGHEALTKELLAFGRLFSSNLAEAELRSAFERENVESPERLLAAVTWVLPSRPLTEEYRQVLSHGHLGGADLFHVACALFLRRELSDLAFVSSNRSQQLVAHSLGM